MASRNQEHQCPEDPTEEAPGFSVETLGFSSGMKMWEHGFYFFHDEIHKDSFLEIVDDLIEKIHRPGWDRKITILINTPGGDLEATLGFIDFLNLFDIRFTTIGLGAVKSAGLLLLMSGTERFASRHCHIMSHRFSGEVGILKHGEVSDLNKEWDKVYDRLIEIYKAGSKYRSKATIEKHLLHKQSDVVLTGEEALTHGLVDYIF